MRIDLLESIGQLLHVCRPDRRGKKAPGMVVIHGGLVKSYAIQHLNLYVHIQPFSFIQTLLLVPESHRISRSGKYTVLISRYSTLTDRVADFAYAYRQWGIAPAPENE
jgi:hypothetical protein